MPQGKPSSLKSDWGNDANDAIHMLFELEEAFCLEPIKVGGTVVLALPEDMDNEDRKHWQGRSIIGIGTIES